MAPQLKDVAPGFARGQRRPNFPVDGIVKPFGIYPIYAFPMLPGESVDYASLAGRFISQPMKHPIAGAWLEFWIASCPVRLYSEALVSQQAPSLTGLTYGADTPRMFGKSGQVANIKLAYDKITQEYFQRPGEVSPTLDGVMQAPIVGVDWMENLMPVPDSINEADMPEDAINTELTGFALEDEMSLMEINDYRRVEQMFGVGDPESQSRPRIHRYLRTWQLPQVVVDPATGAPRSAHYFDVKLNLQKRFKVREHSVVMVLACWRPFMVPGLAAASVMGRLQGLKEWLPPSKERAWSILNSDDAVFTANLLASTDTLVYDRSDVFVRGEHFSNCGSTETPYPVPKTTNIAGTGVSRVRGNFCSSAEIDALFVGANATDKVMHYQGMGQARIFGHVREVAEA